MSTVKNALAHKSGALIHVRSGDMVVEALRQMRVVKDIIRDLEHNVDDLMGYIMKDGPGG
jgi:succinate dehydrogenase/fumarate reductase-like Fe-S protein